MMPENPILSTPLFFLCPVQYFMVTKATVYMWQWLYSLRIRVQEKLEEGSYLKFSQRKKNMYVHTYYIEMNCSFIVTLGAYVLLGIFCLL